MAPKGGNAKKESGRAKKAENEAKKKEEAQMQKERKEADKWADGSKTSKAKEEKEERRKAELARKQERERLLAEEEASIVIKPKPNPKAAGKKKQEKESKPAGPGALAAGGGLASVSVKEDGSDAKGKDKAKEEVEVEVEEHKEEPESFAATGIDDALDLLDVVTAKTDKASVGQQAAGIERHPEVRGLEVDVHGETTKNLITLLQRRFKAAFEAYQERELPNFRKEHPGLRLQQYKELMYKQFQKSPENPFNQTVVSYDASKEEKVEALERRNKEVAERLKEKTKALRLDD